MEGMACHEVADAYERKAAYRQAENDSSPLSVGAWKKEAVSSGVSEESFACHALPRLAGHTLQITPQLGN